jgi:4-hydroxy-2-oxoheptanedioate aldolase
MPAAQQQMPSPEKKPGHLNSIIDLLAAGKPAIGVMTTDTSPASAMALAKSPADFIYMDFEHGNFDMPGLKVFMQFLIDPGLVARQGRVVMKPVIVRIPANGREMNQWMAKTLLDMGVHGVTGPHIEMPEQAINLVKAMRYHQKNGVPDFEPIGVRGQGYGEAARLWGMPNQEYGERADVWPLDPNGELLAVVIIEDVIGVQNAEKTLSVPGIGAAMVGEGDLLNSYGGDRAAEQKGVEAFFAACKKTGVACGGSAGGPKGIDAAVRAGQRFLLTGADGLPEIVEAAKKASGRQ